MLKSVELHLKVSNQLCANWIFQTTQHFYGSFKANNCIPCITSNLKCLDLFRSTTISLFSCQKLYVKIAFGVSPSVSRVLLWLHANKTLVLCIHIRNTLLIHCSLQWQLYHCLYPRLQSTPGSLFATALPGGARQVFHDVLLLSCLGDPHSDTGFLGSCYQILWWFDTTMLPAGDALLVFLQSLHQNHLV